MVTLFLCLATAPVPAAPVPSLPPGCLDRLGGGKFTHPDRPTALAFSPDGDTLYSGGTDGCARAWNTNTGELLATVRVPDGIVTGLAVSALGDRVAVQFGGDELRIFDAKLKAVTKLAAPAVECLVLSADGSLAAGVSYTGEVFVRATATGTDRVRLPNAKWVAFNPAGDRLLHAAADGTLSEFEVIGGRETWKVQLGGEPTGLAVHPKSGRVLAATAEKVLLYEPGAKEPFATLNGGGPVAFAWDRIAVLRGDQLTVHNLETKNVFDIPPIATTFAVGHRIVATAGVGGRIEVFDWVGGPGTNWYNNALEADGKSLSASWYYSDRPFDRTKLPFGSFFPAPKTIPTSGPADPWWPYFIHPTTARSVDNTFFPPPLRFGRFVGLEPFQHGLHFVDAPTRSIAPEELARQADRCAAGDYTAGPDRVTYGRDRTVGPKAPTCLAALGPKAAVGSADRSVWLFDAGKHTRTFAVPGEPQAAALLPGGTKLVVVGRDGFTRLWDVAANPPAEVWKTRVPRGLTADVAASPDGKLVAVAAAVRVEVADAATGRRVFTLDRRWEDGPFTSVAFSPDGRLIAAGNVGSAGGVTAWEVATRTPAYRFEAAVGTTTKVAFFDRGRKLASAHADESVMIWDATGRAKSPAPTTADREFAWKQLLKLEAKDGVAGVHTLAASLDVVPFLTAEVADAAKTKNTVAGWIARLDAPAFADRAAAQKNLSDAGLVARPAVEAAAEDSASAEVRTRAAAILKALDRAGERLPAHGLYGDELRLTRAAWVLELAGGPDADAVLEVIRARGGRAGAEAAAALARRRAGH